jgi:thiol-disulfide isomerase/thioredoxin
MTPRHLVFAGALLVAGAAVGAVWLGQKRPDTEISGAGATAGGATKIPAVRFSSDEPIELRFLKNPAAAAPLTLKTIDGRTLSSNDLRGKVTFINFWATWCPPCRAEIPSLIELQERYRDHLTIIGVSEDEDALEEVKQFVGQHKINYPIVMSTPDLQQAFPGVVSLPTTFVLDKELRIVQKHIGLLPSAATEAEARALAGLPVEASIQYVERDAPVGLANAAQAKEIPGVDLTKLTPQQRTATLVRLNAEPCECGCGLSVAKCRIDDPACGVSLPLARRIVAEMAAKPAS